MLVLTIVFAMIASLGICAKLRFVRNEKIRKEIIERREKYVKSLSESVRIIVNNGNHLFFKDDEKQFFGLDENGRCYDFAGLLSVAKYKDTISFMHIESTDLYVGKKIGDNSGVALDASSEKAIYTEMMPVLRENVHNELREYGITSAHEYEHDGEIIGCDFNTRQFYYVCGCLLVYNFSELTRVTVEDLSNNRLCSANYEINIYMRDGNQNFFHFDCKDSTFYDILAMFKAIRQYQYV